MTEVYIVTTWIAFEGGEPLGVASSEEEAVKMISSDMGNESFKQAVPVRDKDGSVSYNDPKCESYGYSYVKATLNKALR